MARYHIPIFAALAAQQSEALQALLQIEVQKLPPSSTFHKLDSKFTDLRQDRNLFGRSFAFKPDIISPLIEKGEDMILDIFLATKKVDLNNSRSFGNYGAPTPLELAISKRDKVIVQILLHHGANPNLESSPSLVHAAREGNEDIVRLLIEKGAQVNTVFRGQTPLSSAARHGFETNCLLLLNAGANIMDKSGGDIAQYINAVSSALDGGHINIACTLLDRGGTIQNIVNRLKIAMGKKDENMIRFLYTRSATDISPTTLMSLLHYAVDHGSMAFTLQMLTQESDFISNNSADYELDSNDAFFDRMGGNESDYMYEISYKCLLCKAAGKGKESVVRSLLDKGFDVNGYCGSYPLYEAAKNAHETTIELLLDRGAGIKDKSKKAALLSLAASNRDEGAIKLLLEKGVNIDGPYMHIHLCEAAKNGFEAIVRLLLDRGANVEGGGQKRSSPLFSAVNGGHENIVQLLLDRGANIEGGDQERSPLNYAASIGYKAIVRLLLDYGANIEGRHKDSESPLYAAADRGHKVVVQFLLDCGANIEGGEQATMLSPLCAAAANRNLPIVRLLVERGAQVNKRSHWGATLLKSALYRTCNSQDEVKNLVSFLLDSGADASIRDKDNKGLLSMPGLRWDVVQLLKNNGATV